MVGVAESGQQHHVELAGQVCGTLEKSTGAVTFDNGVAVAEFACEEDALTIALRSTAERIPKFESVIGERLVRFNVRDELSVGWTRSDGSPGSVQRNAPLNGNEPS